MLWHVIEKVKEIVPVIVATPDKEIAGYANECGVESFIGSEDDVLDRYYQAAKTFGVLDIIRLTADNPLIRPNTIRRVVQFYLRTKHDYVSNCYPINTYPVGDTVEVLSFKALERAWQETTEPYDREHVTPYIYNSGLFKLGTVRNDEDLSHIRWTVDTQEDLDRVREIYKEAKV